LDLNFVLEMDKNAVRQCMKSDIRLLDLSLDHLKTSLKIIKKKEKNMKTKKKLTKPRF